MKCPFCGEDQDKVIESRTINDGEAIRRRRECEACSERFTSYERVEPKAMSVVKKDGLREPYNRNKILKGLLSACEKRPVSRDDIDRLILRVEKKISASAEKEVKTTNIGEWVMDEMEKLDPIAYVRFASVYREFKSVNEFVKEIKSLS